MYMSLLMKWAWPLYLWLKMKLVSCNGCMASVLLNPNEGGVAFSPSEGGLASVPVSISEVGVASVPVCFITNSHTDIMRF